jgi:hypothetical protein
VPDVTEPAISTADYRRQARRLRCRLAGNPAQLQRSLLTLSRRRDHAPSVTEVRRVSPTQRFTSILYEQVGTSAGVLRYSKRLALLRAARTLGLGRFEANLLIAAVIERQRRQDDELSSQDTGRAGSLVTTLTVVGLLQSAVALGTWWTIFH